MFERYADAARRALFFSRRETGLLGHQRIETQHLLLGILREDDPVTAELWRAFGLDPLAVRARYVAAAEPLAEAAEVPVSEEVSRILGGAVDEADQRGERHVMPVHLVLAILREPECAAAKVLAAHGIEYEAVSEIVRAFAMTAALQRREPIGLRESHDALLERLGASVGQTRQSVALALMDALAASGIAEARFSSLDELRHELRAALEARWPRRA
jgi:ATP-dependent Clp protease ATP-binding subunit ClpA